MPKSTILPDPTEAFSEKSRKPQAEIKTETKKRTYKRLIDEVKGLFKAHNKRLTVEKMKELIVATTQYDDFVATGACFIICGLLEYYYHNYGEACEYLVQLVWYFFFIFLVFKKENIPIR